MPFQGDLDELGGDAPARLELELELAFAYWSTSWSALAGWRVVVASDVFIACGKVAPATGCTDFDSRTITIGYVYGTCVEYNALPHEIGHAALHLTDHSDRRFRSFDQLWLSTVYASCGYAFKSSQFPGACSGCPQNGPYRDHCECGTWDAN